MNDITKIERKVKDLEKGLLTKIVLDDEQIDVYEIYIGYYIQSISDTLITIYDIEFDRNIHVIVNESFKIYQYKQPNPLADFLHNSFTEGNRN
jgi:hypothetical protein